MGTRLKGKKIEIVKLSDLSVTLKLITDRSLNDLPPFYSTTKHKDIGFRDCLIWDTTCWVRKNKSSQLCFISNDQKAYGKKCELFTNLKEQSDVYYYNSLDEFLNDFAEKIKFINEKYLEDAINEIAEEEINELLLPEELFNVDFDKEDITAAQINDYDYESVFIWNYYVYKGTSKYYFVYLNCSIVIKAYYLDDQAILDDEQIYNDTFGQISRSINIRINRVTKKVEGFIVRRQMG